MSQRDVLTELRTARVEAPAPLRARVRLIAAQAPAPKRSRRRFALVLVPVVAAAVAAGVFFSTRTSSPQPIVLHGYAANSGSVRTLAPAPSAKRAQRYGASLQLQVRNVQKVVSEALRITASLSGFAASVHIDTSTQHGSATLTLRIPRTHVQTAVARLSRLGTVTGEQVDIQDAQAGLNTTDRLIARLERELKTAPKDQAALLTARIKALQRQRAATVRAVHFATVHLSVATPPHAVKKHHHYLRDALPWVGGAGAVLILLLALRGLAALREARLLSRF
ncbi:MAG TPA: DUF4349 domain-containing protein [Gaiellaceae bacterium]|nr:DUF4349 domain-containing protein [Gaiellaceae bacterium]